MIAQQTYYLDRKGDITTNAEKGVVLVVRKGLEIGADILRRFPTIGEPASLPIPKANKKVLPITEVKKQPKPAIKRGRKKKVN
jgi:hypothetical protein